MKHVFRNESIKVVDREKRTYVENIETGTGVETGLLVGSVQEDRFRAGVGVECGVDINLETLGNLILELNGVLERVGGCPSLGEDETVLPVGKLGLKVSFDVVGLGVSATGYTESDAGGSVGLDLKTGRIEVVVLAEQVAGRLAKVLQISVGKWGQPHMSTALTFHEGGTGWGREISMEAICEELEVAKRVENVPCFWVTSDCFRASPLSSDDATRRHLANALLVEFTASQSVNSVLIIFRVNSRMHLET